MVDREADDMLAQIHGMPARERWRSPRKLGEVLSLTNTEREQLRLWRIYPADMSERQMANWRKARKRLRQKLFDERRRQKAGSKPHTNSLAQLKPWNIEGMSRATWYRRQRETEKPTHAQTVRQKNRRTNSFYMPVGLSVSLEVSAETPQESAGQRKDVRTGGGQ